MKRILDLKNLLIAPEDNIRSAMAVLDKSGAKIGFVSDKEKKLIGSLSDGDIRRYILSGGKVEDNVLKAANLNCYTLNDDNAELAYKFLVDKKIVCAPVIDKNKKIECVYFIENPALSLTRAKIDLPVVIQAGGLGTRLYPYTHILPKALIPIGEKPITELIINSFCEYGCTDFYMIVNHKRNMIKAYYAEIEKKYTITFIDEDVPLGTAGGLSLLKGKIFRPFFFTNCDILLDAEYSDIYKTHTEKKNIATVISAIKHYKIPYGVLKLDGAGNIDSMMEKPEIDYITNTGVYLLDNKVIDDIKSNQSVSMPEVLQKYLDLGQSVGVYPITDNCWNDMGQIDELQKMQNKLYK